MTISTVQELNRREGKINLIKHIFKRMVRFYPIYLFFIGLNCALSGLPQPSSQFIPTHCEFSPSYQDWPMSLVFLHALFPTTRSIHMLYTWSIAYDLFYYILSCLVLCIYYKKKTVGYMVALAIITFSTVYTGMISYKNNLSPLFMNLLLNRKEMNLVYFNPICRVSSYIVGIVFGLIYLANKRKGDKVSVAYEVKDRLGDTFERNCLEMCKIKKFRTCLYVSGFGILVFFVFGLFF